MQYSCAGCQRAHKRVKSAAGHEFVSITAALKGELKEKLAHCVKHPALLLNSYCGKCNEIVCAECAVENHDLHGAQKLEGIIVTQKEELEALITKGRPLFFFLLFLFSLSHSCATQAKEKDQEFSVLVKTVIATVDGVRTQGKAALREVEAVFKKLHEELEVRKTED